MDNAQSKVPQGMFLVDPRGENESDEGSREHRGEVLGGGEAEEGRGETQRHPALLVGCE